MGVGRSNSGDAPISVGLNRREQLAGTGAGMSRAVGRRLERRSVGALARAYGYTDADWHAAERSFRNALDET